MADRLTGSRAEAQADCVSRETSVEPPMMEHQKGTEPCDVTFAGSASP
jgi:hypothetical protein